MDNLRTGTISVKNIDSGIENVIGAIEGIKSHTLQDKSLFMVYDLGKTELRGIVGVLKERGYDVDDSKLGNIYKAEKSIKEYSGACGMCKGCC